MDRPLLDAEELKAALQTAAPEDDGFVERVVMLVNEGTLSRSLFESTFLWARKKPARRFQYFKYGLLSRLPNQELPISKSEQLPPRVTPSGPIAGGMAAIRWLFQRIHLPGGNG
jgi:hypothetical protein